MNEEIKININTQIDTKSAENELGRFASTVNKIFNIISAIMGSVVGKIKGMFNFSDITRYLKQSIGAAMDLSTGNKSVEQFSRVAQAFGEKLTALKIAVGSAIMPIASLLMEMGSQLIGFLERVANSVGQLIAKMFGAQVDNNKSSTVAAKGQTALAQATKAAGAAAKGALAAFDELNVLQQKGGAGGGAGGKPTKPDKPDKPDQPEDGVAQLTFLEQLLEALKPLTEEAFAGLRWGYEKVLLPLSQWVGNQLLPTFLEALGKASGALATVLELLKPAATWLWESFLQPLGQWTGEMVLVALEGIGKAFEAVSLWIEDNKIKLDELWEKLQPLLTILSETVLAIFDSIKVYFELWIAGFTRLLTGALDLWLGLITGDWALAWKSIQTIFETGKTLLLGSFELLWQAIKDGFAGAWSAVKLAWAPAGAWFLENVMTPLKNDFGWLWDGVMLGADIALKTVSAIWEPFADWFLAKVIQPVSGWVQDMWNEIYGLFRLGLDTLWGALKDFSNLCLELAESGANILVGIFNRIISALNSISIDIPDWVPEYGGRSFGISIPTIPTVSMPRLATGAVIPANAQFAAILGDQRNGRNLEAPEGLIREIVREESAAQEIIIRFEGSMAQLARVLAPALEQENVRQGTRLVMGGVV